MTDNDDLLPYSAVVIKLLKGNLFKDDIETWNSLIQYQQGIKKHFSSIGVEVFINEADGYAFLTQKEYEESSDVSLPSLIGKTPLSYSVTLLCVLLEEKLIEHDFKGGDSPRLILDKKDIYSLMRTYLPETSNETKFIRDIDSDINKLVNYGFLKRLSTDENKLEVRKILMAKIPADTLLEIKEKLMEHAKLTH
ncbi:DUF4194 domain-containing protein [Methanolobus psychrotolerans]|uniref:DUF4194 domain-containing protein n=1 Tax=Methanolobus psychrotolerans TaxID=1874706 RepID=UPI000B91A24A|nr:DUF4194 domain-containing protein [Methanolobus psychrotolerans]